MIGLWSSFQKWFNAIPFDDPLDRQQAVILQGALLVLIPVGILFVLLAPLDTRIPIIWAVNFISNALFTIIGLLALVLLRRGNLRGAALSIVGCIFALIVLSLPVEQVGRGNSLLFFAMPIVFAGLLLRRRELFAMIALCIIFVSASFLLTPQGAESQLFSHIAHFSVTMLLIGLPLGGFIRAYRVTIETLRLREHSLAEANMHLEAEIIKREQAQREQILQQERTEMMRDLIGTFSHDLKTPLAVMTTSIEMLERTTDPARQRERFYNLKQQTERLDKLVQDMLTLSRLDYTPILQLLPQDMNVIVQDVYEKLHMAAEQKDVALNLHLQDTLPPMLADHDELHRVLINLVENAVNYTPASGSVRVKTTSLNGHVMAEVSDTGMGIDAADLDHVFERFYRSAAARSTIRTGSGLGLAIVKRVIDMHNGRIEVRSEAGQGSTFSIWIPYALS